MFFLSLVDDVVPLLSLMFKSLLSISLLVFKLSNSFPDMKKRESLYIVLMWCVLLRVIQIVNKNKNNKKNNENFVC